MADTNQWFIEQITELKRMAHHVRRHLRPGQTLNSTALVNEAWFKLVHPDGTPIDWENRAAFFQAASRVLRNRVIDYLRSRDALRRGGGRQRVEVEDLDIFADGTSPEVASSVLECLEKLSKEEGNALAAEAFTLRFVFGLEPETVEASLEIEAKELERLLRRSKLLLAQCLKRGADK